MTRLGPAWVPIFHVAKGVPYHVENSIGGLNRAVTAGADSIDLDWQVTEADPHCRYHKPGTCPGHPVNTHWPRPLLRDGFRDPLHKIGRFRRVADMDLDEALRLRTRDGYRIHTDLRMFTEARERGLKVAAEVKSGRFAIPAVMESLKAAQESAGAKVRVMKLSDGDKPLATLRTAKAVGFQTILIARGPVPDTWRPFIDFERGPARFYR